MSQQNQIELVDVDRNNGLAVVTFSDGTVATYSAAELVSLKPERITPEIEPDEPEPPIFKG